MALRISGMSILRAARKLSGVGRCFSGLTSRNIQSSSSLTSSSSTLLHQSSRSMVGWWHRPSSGAISKQCGGNTCCRLHTENDQNLHDFLQEEIKLESEMQKNLPKIKDFSISSNDAEVTLTKSLGDEKVTVKFNVNHSVGSADMTEDEGQEPEMLCKPPFTVEIEKGGKTLALSCVFTEDVADPQSGEQYADTLEIEEVTFHGGEWKEQTYTVSASIMDGNLYDHLLNLLEDRGIDEQFVEQLIEYSTRFEHQNYLGFLHNLQGFVKK